MSGDDVDVILQNYFATIAEKDADAFKLYEDNKRMRTLVEQTLHARDDLERRHGATLVLIDSLQAAVAEKDCLIAAQESENAASRDHIAELRVLLDRPSELDHGLDDIVEDVRSITAELRSLRHAFQYAQWCCDGWEGYAVEAIVHAEARERALQEEAAASVLQVVVRDASDILETLRAAAHRQKRGAAVAEQWASHSAKLEGQCEALTEAHGRELADAVSMARDEQERGDALQRELTIERERLSAHVHEAHLRQQRHAVEEACQKKRVSVLEERCCSAETKWALSVKEVRSVVHLLAAARQENTELLTKHEAVLLAQEHSRMRLAKLTKQVDTLTQRQRDLDALQQRCGSQQEELRTLREKYLTAADKERNLRQQLHNSTESSTTKLQAAEEAALSSQRQRYAAEERLRATQEELKTLQKEATTLRRHAEEHRAVEVLLQATQEQLRETERHAFNFQAAFDTLKAEQQAQLRAVEAQHATDLTSLSETHADEVRRVAESGQRKVEAAEAIVQAAREAHAKEKAELQRELQEWIAEVEAVKQEKLSLQDRLESERSARQLLERQHRQETSVVRTMMEQSREEAQRGPQLSDLQLQIRTLEQRNELLEETCRRSAGVIAQLRENLHREQMTSRSLRQRHSSFSSVH